MKSSTDELNATIAREQKATIHTKQFQTYTRSFRDQQTFFRTHVDDKFLQNYLNQISRWMSPKKKVPTKMER